MEIEGTPGGRISGGGDERRRRRSLVDFSLPPFLRQVSSLPTRRTTYRFTAQKNSLEPLTEKRRLFGVPALSVWSGACVRVLCIRPCTKCCAV